MKPSQERDGVLIETGQESDDSCEALIDFSSSKAAKWLIKKLEESEPPIELTPGEGPLLHESLELASEHHSTEEPRRSRIHSMLNEYEACLKKP
jgi:hypothetical protein